MSEAPARPSENPPAPEQEAGGINCTFVRTTQIRLNPLLHKASWARPLPPWCNMRACPPGALRVASRSVRSGTRPAGSNTPRLIHRPAAMLGVAESVKTGTAATSLPPGLPDSAQRSPSVIPEARAAPTLSHPGSPRSGLSGIQGKHRSRRHGSARFLDSGSRSPGSWPGSLGRNDPPLRHSGRCAAPIRNPGKVQTTVA